VLDLLSRLVDASMATAAAEPDLQSMRFGLQETLRQYAAERMAAKGPNVFRDCHAAFYLDLIERAEFDLLGGPRQMSWLTRIDREHDNFRIALRWLQESGDIDRAQRLAGVLYRYWFQRGYLVEGRAILAQLLAQPGVTGRLCHEQRSSMVLVPLRSSRVITGLRSAGTSKA
jgi:predicted ATPase